MSEFLNETWLSLALIAEVVIAGFNEFGWLEPGVLDADLWFRGDDGAEPTVLWDYLETFWKNHENLYLNLNIKES